MDAKIEAPATSNTNSFEPLSDFVQEDSCDTLLLYLPGFTKEQLRVQLNRSGVLKISGTRPLGDNKWSSFQKDFPVSANCETNKITAKFEEGILYVRQPKLIVPAEKQDEKKHPPTKTTPDKPPATTAKTHQAHGPAESNKEAKSTEDEHKVNKLSEGAKKDEKINNTPEKKTGTTRDEDDHKAAMMRSSDKRDTVSGKNKANHQSAYGGTNRNDIGKSDDYKMAPAARLKMVRQKMTIVLAVLLAFALGMFVSNPSWFSKKPEN